MATKQVPEVQVPNWQALCLPASVSSSGKAIDPAAQGLLVEITEEGGVRVTGTDLGLWGIGLYGEGGVARWAGVVPARAAAVPGTVTLTPEADGLRLTCGDGASYRLATLGSDHFPPAPVVGGEPTYVPDLVTALAATTPAVSSDPSVLALCGVLLEATGEAVGSTGFVVHATGHGGGVAETVILAKRLVEATLAVAGPVRGAYLVTQPPSEEAVGTAEISGVAPGEISWWMVGKTVGEKYPRWRKLTTATRRPLGVVAGGDLADAVAKATLLAEAHVPLVDLVFGKEGLAVYLHGDPTGQEASGALVGVDGDGGRESQVLVEAVALRAALAAAGAGRMSLATTEQGLVIELEGFLAVVSFAGDEEGP